MPQLNFSMVKEFKGYEAQPLVVGGNATFQACSFRYVTVDDKELSMAQIARAIWKNNKIVNERFFGILEPCSERTLL